MVHENIFDVLPKVRLSRRSRLRATAMLFIAALLLAGLPTPNVEAVNHPSTTRLKPVSTPTKATSQKPGKVAHLGGPLGGPIGGHQPLTKQQHKAIQKLLAKKAAGKVFAAEEVFLLNRYEKGRKLSQLDAQTLISRVLYYEYVNASRMEASPDLNAFKDLLAQYRARVARRDRVIEDERLAGGHTPELTGGPDGFGYTFIDTTSPGGPTFNFVDIATSPNYVGSGDDSAFTINLGGPGFCFYSANGTGYTQLRVATNGYISTLLTDSGPDLSNDCPIPRTPSSGGGGRIYVDHDDLVTDIFHTYDAGMQANIVQWQGTHFSGGNPLGNSVNFEVILFDSGDMLMQYQQDDEQGSGSTRGIQDASPPTTGLQHSCNTSGSVTSGLAILFLNPVPCGTGGGGGCAITCPAPITVDATSTDGAVVTYATPVPAGDCTVVCQPASGSIFPVGTTTVNCVATPNVPTHPGPEGATTTTYSSGNIAVPIPDANPGGATVTINVPDPESVVDVDVRVRINHTWDEDLDISLIGPNSTQVDLSSDNGGSGDNFGLGSNDCSGTPTVFDDEAGTPIAGLGSGSTPFAGSFIPEQSLSAFDGISAAGTWTLFVADDLGSDTGTIGCFELVITRDTGGGGGGGGTDTCSFPVTVSIPYDVCCVDDATGNIFLAVVNSVPSNSSLYGLWQFQSLSTSEVFMGKGTVKFAPGARILLADNVSPHVRMSMQVDYGRHTCTGQVRDLITGRNFTFRDRNIDDNMCETMPPPPPPPPPTKQ